jgi:hypothetical protein
MIPQSCVNGAISPAQVYISAHTSERCHPGLGNKLIVPTEQPPHTGNEIESTA